MASQIAGFKLSNWLKSSRYCDSDNLPELEKLTIELLDGGLDKLAAAFYSQVDADRALDILLEMWFARALLREPSLMDVRYEPPPERPDFTFVQGDVTYFVQVKRLLNFCREVDKRRFLEALNTQPPIKRPWFIHVQMNAGFCKQHFNPFMEYLRKKQNSFRCEPLTGNFNLAKYSWPPDGETLVTFSFSEGGSLPHLHVGGSIWSDSGLANDAHYEPKRRAVHAQLKAARKTLGDLSATVCSIVVLQPSSDLFLDHFDMLNVLYGTKTIGSYQDPETGNGIPFTVRNNAGLFQPHTFFRIASVIMVKQHINLLREDFQGTSYPHMRHAGLLESWPLSLNGLNRISLCEFERGPFRLHLK